jgi:hypothetical protein
MAKKPNPHCIVPGCKTKQPHLDDSIIKGLHKQFSEPVNLTQWIKHCIAEIISSVKDDLKNGRVLAYLTRQRQPEELYYRVLYILFVADEAEIPHVLSGEIPNGFAAIWRKVNEEVLEGKGKLDKTLLGLKGEEFTPMDTINQNAHVSFSTVLTVYDLVRNPGRVREMAGKSLFRWYVFCNYLDYMEQKFREGKSKHYVLVGVRSLPMK